MKQKVVYDNHKSICTFNFDFIKTTILNGMGVTGNIVGQVKIDFLNILPSFPSLPFLPSLSYCVGFTLIAGGFEIVCEGKVIFSKVKNRGFPVLSEVSYSLLGASSIITFKAAKYGYEYTEMAN